MTTDAWGQAKAKFLGFWRVTRPGTAQIIETHLEDTRAALTDPRTVESDALTNAFGSQWSSRIEELITENGEAKEALISLIADLSASLNSEERNMMTRVRLSVKTSGHGTTNVLGQGIQLNYRHE
jgi:hypothetical protein